MTESLIKTKSLQLNDSKDTTPAWSYGDWIYPLRPCYKQPFDILLTVTPILCVIVLFHTLIPPLYTRMLPNGMGGKLCLCSCCYEIEYQHFCVTTLTTRNIILEIVEICVVFEFISEPKIRRPSRVSELDISPCLSHISSHMTVPQSDFIHRL